MSAPTGPEQPQHGNGHEHRPPASPAMWQQIMNTIVSVVLIGCVTFLAAVHDLQVGVVSAIFVTLIAHQFGSFTLGRRADDPPR